ncbi:tetratricopeptide repeat protein [bacterium SCSIO 12741]|nr:tetratricopeptide repeat protein [bacterium SCSIO 12741]
MKAKLFGFVVLGLALLFQGYGFIGVGYEALDDELPENYYLLDSVPLNELSESDRYLLDSCLNLFHCAESDTDRIKSMAGVCAFMVHECYNDYQKFIVDLTEEYLKKKNDKKTELRLLRSYGSGLNNLGIHCEEKGDLKRALYYFHKGLKIADRLEIEVYKVRIMINIGLVYRHQDNYALSLEHFNKCVHLAAEIEDNKGIAASLINLGHIYEEMGDYEGSIKHFQRALILTQEANMEVVRITCLQKIGNNHFHLGRLNEAIEYGQQSLDLSRELGYSPGIVAGLVSLAQVHLQAGQIALAEEEAKRALAKAQKLGYPELIKGSSKVLSTIYRLEGNWEQAFEMYELYVGMRDSLHNVDVEREMLEIAAKNEFEKEAIYQRQRDKDARDQLDKEKERSNRLQYSGIGVILFMLFGGLFLMGNYSLPTWVIELAVFVPFLILFEFLLVLTDPYVEEFTGGIPMYKLMINAVMGGMMFPIHSFFESRLKSRLFKQ